jgi:hypothetical protein
MDASVWGPALWDALFCVAFKKRPDDAASDSMIAQLLETLVDVIPCKHCRRSYRKYVEAFPIPTRFTSKDIALWLWRCKDRVNQKLGKPYKCFPDVERRYMSFHCILSEVAALDLLIMMSMVATGENCAAVARFAGLLGQLLRHVLGDEFATRLVQCSAYSTEPKALQNALSACMHDQLTVRGVPMPTSDHARAKV